MEKVRKVNEKGDVGMTKRFYKMYGTKDEFLMSRCLSAPDATSLPTSLPQEQVAKTKMLSVVRVQQKECLVLCSMVYCSAEKMSQK